MTDAYSRRVAKPTREWSIAQRERQRDAASAPYSQLYE